MCFAFVAIVIIAAVKLCFVTLIKIPGDGEQPVFFAGDRVSLVRTAYGLRLSPMSWWGYVRIAPKRVSRGDYIAFNNPTDGCHATTAVDRRDIFIARCEAVPGDSLWIDSTSFIRPENNKIDAKFTMHLTKPQGNIRSKMVTLPRKNELTAITPDNIQWYCHIINLHEGVKAKIIHDSLIINGCYTPAFRFLYDYYWMSSADKHNKADSRAFGFVPDAYIIGRLRRIVFSWNHNAPWYARLRTKRILKKVEHPQ